VVDCDDDDVCLSRQASEHDMRPSPTSQTHNPINGEKQAARTARLYMETLGSRNTLVKTEHAHEATRVLSRLESGQTSRGRRGSSHGHGAKEVPPPASPQVPAPCSCPSCLLNPTG
jgi:hypothetical protein